MKITLINPPWYISQRQFLRERKLSQCLGLGYIASYLTLHGHKVEIIDALAEAANSVTEVSYKNQTLLRVGLSYNAVVNRIPEDTELIGVSVPFTNLSTIAKDLCSYIKKKYPRIPIVVGGMHASTFPYDMLDENINYVIRGEGEISMLELASGKDPRKIKGLVYRMNSELFDNGLAEQIDNLDQIPFPLRSPELIERYLSCSPRGQRNKRSLSVITSRGCPYDCNFCSVHPVFGYSWRARSPENVLQEISYYIDRYGTNHIEFEDDNLTLDTKRAEEIFDRILSLNTKITWAVNNGLRVDTLCFNLIEKMKKTGCIQVNLAIESGNQRVLDLMNKRLSLKKAEEVVGLCDKLKVPTLAFFLVGYPGETRETFSATVRYIKRLKKKGLKKVGAMIVNAYPGTKLYHYCKQKGYLARDIDEHIFVESDYVSITTEDFDENLVVYWRDFLEGIFVPFRWRIKQLARLILPNTVFKKLVFFYRSIRDTKLNFSHAN